MFVFEFPTTTMDQNSALSCVAEMMALDVVEPVKQLLHPSGFLFGSLGIRNDEHRSFTGDRRSDKRLVCRRKPRRLANSKPIKALLGRTQKVNVELPAHLPIGHSTGREPERSELKRAFCSSLNEP
jgi:hypothetical protein